VAEEQRPVPRPDPDTAPYWEAAQRGVLAMPHCADCNHYVFPPRPRCPRCHRATLTFREVSGRGRIASFTIMRDTFVRGFPPPYVLAEIALVEQEDLTLVTNIVDSDIDGIAIGQPVRVVFERRTPEVTIPQFTVATEEA
jgi:uncharacterized OB-fold protein